MYHLLAAMSAAGFVAHYPEEERWGLGVASFEIGAAYLRHEPLERLAQPLLRRLVADAENTAPVVAHLGILVGHETLYLLKERSPRPVTVVTEVGVRLPASLTASGRAILAALPRAQVRAQLSTRDAFVNRTGLGPTSLAALYRLLGSRASQGLVGGGRVHQPRLRIRGGRGARPFGPSGCLDRSDLQVGSGTGSGSRGSCPRGRSSRAGTVPATRGRMKFWPTSMTGAP